MVEHYIKEKGAYTHIVDQLWRQLSIPKMQATRQHPCAGWIPEQQGLNVIVVTLGSRRHQRQCSEVGGWHMVE